MGPPTSSSPFYNTESHHRSDRYQTQYNTHVILPEGAQGGDLDGAREHGAGALLQLGHKLSTVLILK